MAVKRMKNRLYKKIATRIANETMDNLYNIRKTTFRWFLSQIRKRELRK